MSTYENGIYGLVIMLLFTLIITVGFVYELGSGALHIDSRQYQDSHSPHTKSVSLAKASLHSSMFNTSIKRYFSISAYFAKTTSYLKEAFGDSSSPMAELGDSPFALVNSFLKKISYC